MRATRFLLAVLVLVGVITIRASAADDRPNIVYILADDLGYGDVKALNKDGKIPTPNLDKLAASGMAFTDAHSGSAVCTPTRYGILTGRYAWRSRLKSGVLGGYSPRLIEPGLLTVPAMLREKGYATGCIGKWHLGMDMPLKEGGSATDYKDQWKVDYAKPIVNGPTSVGFDFYFGISASLDMPPYVFIENNHFAGVPTVDKKWIRQGPAEKDFEAIDVLPRITKVACDWIGKQAKAGKPFFAYVPFTAPHTPILPTKDWQGKSGINDYADFVMQVDESACKIFAAIEAAGVTGKTLVVFTSDNGCSPSANFPELLAKGHNPSYVFRGHKADIFDGGHRIPFLVRWPGKIKPGSTSDQTVCLTDLMATVAEIVGEKTPPSAAVDSVSLLPVLTGVATAPIREAVVHHSINGSFAIRQGNWKLELCPDSGGWSAPKPGTPASKALPPVQLYDLSKDIAEQENVAAKNPEVVARLTKLLEKYGADGRSTPGEPQKNTGDVNVHRKEKAAAKKPGEPEAN